MVFVSFDRNSLISDLYRAFDHYIYENIGEIHEDFPHFLEICNIFYDNFNDDQSLEEAKIVVFRTAILVIFKENKEENLELLSMESASPLKVAISF